MNEVEEELPVRNRYFLQILADTNKQNGLPLSQGSALILMNGIDVQSINPAAGAFGRGERAVPEN